MTEPLRVLRITPHLYRAGGGPVAFDPVGGLQTQVWRLAEELDKTGISQTVLTSYIPGHPRCLRPFKSTQVECVGLPLPGFAAARLLNFTWSLAVARRLYENRSAYDLIHIHYNHSVWCRVLTVIARRLNIPVVVSLSTELWVDRGARMRSPGHKFGLASWIERRAVKSSDCVVALTEGDAARWTRELELERDRVVVIPDAINEENFTAPMEHVTLRKFHARYAIPMNTPVVAYIGRLRSEKGWHDLPAIARELRKAGAFLLICGDGPDRRRLENAMSRVGCFGSWRITGFLDPEEVKVALQIADVLILPSRREAFGSVLLEAMASGLPVVAYAVGGIVEVAGTPNAIRLVPPNDRPAFTRATLELLCDAQHRTVLIERGRRRVEEYSLSCAGQKAANIYQSLRRCGGAAGQYGM